MWVFVYNIIADQSRSGLSTLQREVGHEVLAAVKQPVKFDTCCHSFVISVWDSSNLSTKIVQSRVDITP